VQLALFPDRKLRGALDEHAFGAEVDDERILGPVLRTRVALRTNRIGVSAGTASSGTPSSEWAARVILVLVSCWDRNKYGQQCQ
jgi:hypothetical protein